MPLFLFVLNTPILHVIERFRSCNLHLEMALEHILALPPCFICIKYYGNILVVVHLSSLSYIHLHYPLHTLILSILAVETINLDFSNANILKLQTFSNVSKKESTGIVAVFK